MNNVSYSLELLSTLIDLVFEFLFVIKEVLILLWYIWYIDLYKQQLNNDLAVFSRNCISLK